MRSIKVLIIDDHTLFRQGLRQVLELEKDIKVVGEAGSFSEGLREARVLEPDVILMDIALPDGNGIMATRAIMEQNPRSKVLILTMYREDDYVFQAIRAGALGYILKEADISELVAGIRAVHRGEAMITPNIAIHILEEFRRLGKGDKVERQGLTKAELEILHLVSQGATNKEIALRLIRSEKTVRNKLSVIFQKLHVRNRTEAALFAVQQELAPWTETREKASN